MTTLIEPGGGRPTTCSRSSSAGPAPADAGVREVDRARPPGPLEVPDRGYDDLTAAEITARLGDLAPGELRKVRDYERRNANRKSVLAERSSASSTRSDPPVRPAILQQVAMSASASSARARPRRRARTRRRPPRLRRQRRRAARGRLRRLRQRRGPGDRVRAEVVKSKRAYAEARAVEILEPSPERIPGPAPAIRARRGKCSPTSAGLRGQGRAGGQALGRLGRLEGYAVDPIVPAARDVALSQQARVLLRRGPRPASSCAASHAPGRFDAIVPLSDCLLASERGNAAREQVLAWGTRREGLSAWDRRTQAGLLRNLVVREGRRTGQLQVRLVTLARRARRVGGLAAAVDCDGLFWTQAARPGESTQGGDDDPRRRPRRAWERSSGGCVSRSRPRPSSRRTPRWPRSSTAPRPSSPACAATSACSTSTAASARSGSRSPRAPARSSASGFVESAVADAIANARANEIQNATFYAGDIRLAMRELVERRRAARRGGRRAATRRALAEGRAPCDRGGAEADGVRLVQPDDARAERRAARRGGLAARARAPRGHVPADPAHRVRGAAGEGVSLTRVARFGIVNAYLVGEDDGMTLVDTGLPGSARAILKAAAERGGRIARIVLTHAHGDHIGSLDRLAADLPGSRGLDLLRRDAKLLRKGQVARARRLAGLEAERLLPGCEDRARAPARWPGDRVGSLEVHAAAGHTPGQIALLVTRGAAR